MESKTIVPMTSMERQLMGASCVNCHHTGIRLVTDGKTYSVLCPTCERESKPSSNRMMVAYNYRTQEHG